MHHNAQTGCPENQEYPVIYRFERRADDRYPATGRATLMRVAGEKFGEMSNLNLSDYGCGGIAAVSDRPVEPGAIVSIGFENPRYQSQRGIVVRCLPCGNGYHIAVRFDTALAA